MGAATIARPRRQRAGYFEKYLIGQGADIGCGHDPVLPDAIKVDQIFGQDAEKPDLPPGSLDYVFSSHCLEHLHDPVKAIQNWWALLKVGGHLVCSVPDWVLYEQRVFPSRFNHDHKWAFSMFQRRPVPHGKHIVLSDLFLGLENCQVLSYQLCDEGFKYTDSDYDRTWFDHAEAEIEIVARKHGDDKWL